jgi:hypothetical protein
MVIAPESQGQVGKRNASAKRAMVASDVVRVPAAAGAARATARRDGAASVGQDCTSNDFDWLSAGIGGTFLEAIPCPPV